jgi:hypothetical protein
VISQVVVNPTRYDYNPMIMESPKLATGQWFSPGTNKSDCHNIAELLLNVAFNTIKTLNKTKCK